MRKRIISMMLVMCMVLSLAPITANAMRIYVDLSVTGAVNLTLNVESGDSIDSVKGKIKEATRYSETIQILKYKGKVLENGRTLADYNIQKDSTIVLYLTPSVSTYATKKQLMDGTFAPVSDGNATNIGKLVFGKDSSGNAQQWYILGKDTGVDGDNTAIFAANPIATGQVFEDNVSNSKTFKSNFGVYESNPSVVYPNHYGASDLRVALKDMETSYFTQAEQNMMNATTVKTTDKLNIDGSYNNMTYTTTDKLYALAADGVGSLYTTIKAGTNDQIVLSMSSYWSSEDSFWLRLPTAGGSYMVMSVTQSDLGKYVGNSSTNGVYAVQPASNLNLSSVLFVSATASSSSATTYGTIKKNTNTGEPKAMILRLDGSSKNIGAALYNTTTGDIKVTKGSTTGNVALVVQGNDGTNDWYYSKQITGDKTVNASTIKSALGISTDIDLSSCKIWLETTDANGMIYAVNAEKEIEKINTTYATKEQLMNSFSTYSDGTATNIGKLVFGKNSSGDAQQWYILGKDTGIDEDNTVIFAANPIATGQMFNSNTSDKTYNYGAGTGYGESAGSKTVFANHYGASDLRVALQGMETSNFTQAEQYMMNATTVKTKDTKNNVMYTTKDKLYALTADGDWGSKTIKAGSNDDKVLLLSKYLYSTICYWLRSPKSNNSGEALGVNEDYPCASYASVNINGGVGRYVRPASNLNLSSVLFASSATAASSSNVTSGTIADGTAMTLRLDGSSKNIGTAICNAEEENIEVIKGSTTQPVALVVQGNDGTNDWYYSKKITGTETVSAADIVALSNTPASVDLSACKIWLETTDANGMIYAVNGEKEISTVEITSIDTPRANTTLDTSAECTTIGVRNTRPTVTWTPNDTIARYNTSYTASVILSADEVCYFTESTTATVNGNAATSVTKNTDGTLTVTYKFSATDKPPVIIPSTPTESFTSPVSDVNAIEIKASISDGVAKVSEITTETIDKMLNNASSNGETKVETIKIDLSGAKQEVKAITLSKKTLETLATAIASEDNDIDTVTIVLSKASVVLDSKTLETVVKEAKGNDIKLVINDKKISMLNTSQQNAIKKYHVATLFEAIFESNGKAIHDFNGGTATVTIDFTPEEGKNMDYYHIVHISDDGVMTRFKTRYFTGKLSFIAPHFSDYAVIYDESEKNQTAIERPIPVTGIDATVVKTTLTKKGAIATIKATVQPEDATNKNVTYTSSNTKVAKVDKNGKVTAVANGKTTVTVKTVDGAFTKKIVITVKIPDPMPTKAQIAANSVVLNSNATAKWTKKNYLKLTWGKVTGAVGYEVYVRKCDGKTLWTKAAYTAKSGKTTSVTLKKLGGKKFSTTANYKYGVRAYKYVNGKKVYIGTSLTYHFVGSKNKKDTNAKSVTAGRKVITLGVKKTTKLTSMVSKVNKKCKLVKHDTLVRYISSNPSVAKVDLRTGKVTGVKAGKCKIYCIALNGVKATVSVTVK